MQITTSSSIRQDQASVTLKDFTSTLKMPLTCYTRRERRVRQRLVSLDQMDLGGFDADCNR